MIETHYRPLGAHRALCGVPTTERQHSSAPTCPECASLLHEEDAQIAALRNAEWDAKDVVKHVPFNPTAGYKPRGASR